MKTILITGINGFLGSHLAKHLKHKFKIIGLEHKIDNLFRIKNQGFNVYESNDATLELIFKNHEIHAVLHVATVYCRQSEPLLSILQTNINLPVRLLELAIQYKVKQFLNTDSFFNDPKYSYSYLSEYSLSKRQSLDWIKLLSNNIDCKVANMKIFHMYGENDSLEKFIPFVIEKIKNNEPFLELTAGAQTRDFIYVKDVVTAFEHVLLHVDKLNQFQEFEVGSGSSYTIKELVTLIKEVTSSTTELRFGALPYREGEIMKSICDNSSLKEIHWNSLFDLKSGIKFLLEVPI